MIIGNGFVDLFVKTTSEAAYASSLLKGKGDKIAADQAAVDKMRLFLNNIPMKGRIVIGEGEMDEAPMLYINELVGTGIGEELDIAVDPLEGTNLTAKNLPNAMSVLAVSKKDPLFYLHCMQGYTISRKQKYPFIVSKQEGEFIRNFRWKAIKKKIL